MVETSSSKARFLGKDIGPLVWEQWCSKNGNRWLEHVGILARCKGTHRTQRPCQETGFPG